MFRPAPWLALHRSLGLEPPPPFDDRPLAEHLASHAVHKPEAVAIQFHDRGIGSTRGFVPAGRSSGLVSVA